MIYLDDHPQDLDLDAALVAVGRERRDYALRYRRDEDRRLCLAAYMLLQRGLLLEYGIDGVPQLVRSAGGKPSISGRPDIHFSLSHCHEAAACVLAARPVGIDVESITPVDADVVAHAMNDREQEIINASPQPDVAFARLWTMKESFYKLFGDSSLLPYGDDPRTLLDGDLSRYRFHTTITPRYVLTVCEEA